MIAARDAKAKEKTNKDLGRYLKNSALDILSASPSRDERGGEVEMNFSKINSNMICEII